MAWNISSSRNAINQIQINAIVILLTLCMFGYFNVTSQCCRLHQLCNFRAIGFVLTYNHLIVRF
ncbi:MAG: hypothetical protein JWP45_396 [Mucilaginibacter sp.]|nr:hypothetical protein [Mucilaginibacter sp.]